MSNLKFIITKIKKYEDIHSFHEGLAAIKNEQNKCGFIDKEGNEVIKCQYKGVSDFHEGLAAIKNEQNRWGFIDKDGKEVVPCKYALVGDFHEGLAVVLDERGLYGYINKEGEEVIPCQYKDASDFYMDLALVKNKQGLYVFINKEGKEVFSAEVESRRDDLGHWGYIDKEGKLIFSHRCHHKDTVVFYDGLVAKRNEEGLWGYINKDGEVEISYQYKWVDDFHEGLARVQNEQDEVFLIDKNNNRILSNEQYKLEMYYDNNKFGPTIIADTKEELEVKKIEFLKSFVGLINEEVLKQENDTTTKVNVYKKKGY